MNRIPLIFAIAVLLTAAAPVPLRLIVTLSPQGVQDVMPGQIVSVANLGKPDAAILASGVTLDWKHVRRTFARGDVIRAAGDTGVSGVPAAIFCEAEHLPPVSKALAGQFAFGLVGVLRPTQLATRYCLFDQDNDGRFDHAFLIGAKGDGAAPFAIPATEYGLIEGQRLASDAVVRLRYVGPAGLFDRIAFDLEAFADGTLHEVPHARLYVPIAKLPAHAIIGTGAVTVLTYDPQTHAATIRMDHDLAPGHILVPELSHGY